MTLARITWTVFCKDMRAEWRAREAVVAMVVFGLLTVVVFNFAFEPAGEETLAIAPGMLWISFTFASMLGLNRSFAMEREAGAITSLRLAPVDRGAIYLGKMLANTTFLLVLQLVVVPVFGVLYNVSLGPSLGRLSLVLVLGAVALSAAGTLYAAVSANTAMREVMTPLLMFPAATPVLIAAVEGTSVALAGEEQGYASSLRLLAVFAVVFTTVSYLLFEYVLEE